MSLSPRKVNPLSESLIHKLNSYATGATAAGVSVLALASSTEAKIVYTPAHVVLKPRIQSLYNLDLNHDGVKDFVFSHGYFYSSTTGFWGSIVQMSPYKFNGNLIMGHGNPPPLKAGVKIGPGKRFSHYGIAAWARGTGRSMNTQFSGAWAYGGKGVSNRYLGLQFAIKGKTHYGWARVSISKFRFKATLTGYAYETTPNKGIVTGKTKERDVTTVSDTLGGLARGATHHPRRVSNPNEY